MEITEEQIQEAASEYAKNTIAIGDKDFLLEVGFKEGARWSIDRGKTDIGISFTEIQYMQRNINLYLSSLKNDSDRLTQFYDACSIAKRALFELEVIHKRITGTSNA